MMTNETMCTFCLERVRLYLLQGMSVKEEKSQQTYGCLPLFSLLAKRQGMFGKPGFEKVFYNKDLDKLFAILFKKKRSSPIHIFVHVNWIHAS